jgi:hypothetical protein
MVREFAVLGIVGTTLAYLITLGPGIALLALFAQTKVSNGRPTQDRERIERLVRRLANWPINRQRIILVAGLILMIAAATVLPRFRTDYRLSEMLPRSSPTRESFAYLDKAYGGVNLLQVQVRTPRSRGMNDPELLNFLQKVEGIAQQQPGVTACFSYAMVLRLMNQVWEGGKIESATLPGPVLMKLFTFALDRDAFPLIDAVVDRNFQTGNLILRTAEMSSDSTLKLLDNLAAQARAIAPPGVELSSEGGIQALLQADRQIRATQTRSVWSTLLTLLVLLWWLWRSFRGALAIVLASFLPVMVMLGISALAGVPLHAITVLVAALVFGLSVDDAIHLGSFWKEKRKVLSPKAAMVEALRAKGGAFLFTNLVLVVSFASLLLSSFPPVRQFAGMALLATAVSLVGAFTFVPAVLLLSAGRTTGGEKPSAVAAGSA